MFASQCPNSGQKPCGCFLKQWTPTTPTLFVKGGTNALGPQRIEPRWELGVEQLNHLNFRRIEILHGNHWNTQNNIRNTLKFRQFHSCNAQKAKGQLRKSRYLGSRKLGFAYFLKVKHWGFLVQQHRNGVFFVVIYNNKPPIREWFIPPIKMVIWGMVCYCFTITLDQIRWLVSFIFRSGELGNETPRSSQHWRSKWPGWHIYIHYMILIWYNYHISIKHVYGFLWIYDINRWTYISTYIYEYLNVEMHVNIYIYICMVPCPVFPPPPGVGGGMS